MFCCRSRNGENSDCGVVFETHSELTAETSSAEKNDDGDEPFYMEL